MADDASPPIETASVDRAARIAATIRAWRDQMIAGGPIARDTACWNHLDAALDSLAAILLKEI
jgi:hypothetical protein